MSKSAMRPFFNRQHLTEGFEALGAVFCVLGWIFVAPAAIALTEPSPSSCAFALLGIACCVIASVVAKSLLPGVVALLGGSSLGAAALCAGYAVSGAGQGWLALAFGWLATILGAFARQVQLQIPNAA
jgi:hypothetical protein